jgi:hypothetical protein
MISAAPAYAAAMAGGTGVIDIYLQYTDINRIGIGIQDAKCRMI